VGSLGVPLAVIAFLAPVASGSTPRSPTLLKEYGGQFVRRPSFLGLTPTDGEIVAGDRRSFRDPGSIRWTSWTKSTADGVGALWVDTCLPSCAGGKEDRYAVSIKASDPRRGRFTLLSIRRPHHSKPLIYKVTYAQGFGGEFDYVSGAWWGQP
jgi:hypothetical protein